MKGESFVLALAGLALAGVARADADWRQCSYDLTEVTRYITKLHVENLGPSTVHIGANSGRDTQNQWVVGAADANPPTWGSYFATLTASGATTYFDWSYSAFDLLAGKGAKFDVIWDYSGGWQEFELYEGGQPTGHKIRRDRDWNANPRSSMVIYPLGNPGGGGS